MFQGLFLVRPGWLQGDGALSWATLAIVSSLTAAFLLCYGARAFRQAVFPLSFLFVLVPIPVSFLDGAATVLQHASAYASYALFKLLGVPVFADGVKLALPGAEIEVARECSGIRSCISLLITSSLAGYVCLRSVYARGCLILLTVPIAILKNAVRIVTISWLGLNVSKNFFYGNLHRRGGVVFSLLALTLMLPIVYTLRRIEDRTSKERIRRQPTVVSSAELAPRPSKT